MKADDLTPSMRAWSWRSPVGPLTTIPILVVFLTGLLVSQTILDESHIASITVRFVRGILLKISSMADIDRFASSTEYKQVALLTTCLHWALLPIQSFAMMALTELGIARGNWRMWKATRGGNGRVGLADLKVLLVGLPLLFGSLVVATMVPGDWSLIQGLTTRNRVGMSVLFLTIFWVTALAINGAYAIARAFVDFNLRGK